MGFDVGDLLENLFGGTVPTAAQPVTLSEPIPQPVAFDIMTDPLMIESDWTAWEDCIAPPPPCPKCGGLELWESMAGGWRCMLCDPPTAALRLLERAEKARARKTAFQNNAGCDAMAQVDKLAINTNPPTPSS